VAEVGIYVREEVNKVVIVNISLLLQNSIPEVNWRWRFGGIYGWVFRAS